MELYAFTCYDKHGAEPFTLRKITTAWTDHGTYPTNSNDGYYDRWRNAKDGVAWTSPGGDLGSVIGSYPAQGSIPQWRKVTLDAATVQSWIRAPSSNHGFMMRNETTVNDAVGFYSMEWTDKTLTPRLTVTYSSNGVGMIGGKPSQVPRSLSITGNRLVLAGTAGVRDAVFLAADGRTVVPRMSREGDITVWDCSGLAPGVYVASVRSGSGHALPVPVTVR